MFAMMELYEADLADVIGEKKAKIFFPCGKNDEVCEKWLRMLCKTEKSTKEIYEDFYKKPYDEITKEDIDECELINWGPDVGGEVIE